MSPVSPKNYEITLEPNFKNFTFAGKEKILVEISKPTDTIVMNAAELTMRGCQVVRKGKTLLAKHKLDEKKEELTLKFLEKISGKVVLEIDFTGVLNDRLLGFYRSEYEEKGRKRILATTQFEAADARRAFPCWDEPEAKATFDVSLILDKSLMAISNMPVVSKKKVGKKVLLKFARTPIMSTYLLYLGVGDFEHVEDKLGKVSIRVVTTKGKKEQGRLALEFVKKFLSYYQEYFGIAYPLPKLDLIALPDFASGAMENWGAITFRESALLFDPSSSSKATKQHIAEIIAHEIAHQWFGNLVTMKWWNDLWLNESFATFMATKAVDHFYPEWDFWDQFIISSVNEAFSLDALKASHPIDVEIKKPSQIREIFDDISYDKGGSVLRMLEDFIGEENFRAGLKKYLTKHKFGNATTEDLWDSLAEVSKKPVREMMNAWVKQVGYPVIEAAQNDSRVSLTQKRFLLDEGSAKETWLIPLSVKMRDRFLSKLMSRKSEDIRLEGSSDWFKINSGQKGFYRVDYNQDALEKLKDLVEERRLDNVDRWGIQNDLFALCVAGKITFRRYLDFIRSYFQEDDYLVSADIAGSLYFAYLVSSGESFWQSIQEYGKEYFEKIFSRLGWDAKDGEKHTDALLRSFVINALGRFGHEEILAEAKRRFEKFVKEPNSLNPDLRSTVYSLVAWGGDEKTFEMLTNFYRKAQTQEEKVRFLAALGGFQDGNILAKTLDFSLSPDVRLQDLFIPIAKVAGNPYGRKLVWLWLRKNWKEVSKRFGNVGNPLLNRIISCLEVVSDGKKESEIRIFFKKNAVPGTEMKLAQTLERIRINSKFLERTRKEFVA